MRNSVIMMTMMKMIFPTEKNERILVLKMKKNDRIKQNSVLNFLFGILSMFILRGMSHVKSRGVFYTSCILHFV